MESRFRKPLAEMIAGPDDALDLAAASLLIAGHEYPELDVPAYLHRLDRMAAAVRERLEGDPQPEAAVAVLRQYLFDDMGFRGNVEDYYDPRNSFLNEVMDRRTGIPITLSTVYMEVGRRLGLDVQGVGLPGHFIVRVAVSSGSLLIDPFQSGARLTTADCQERLDRIYSGRVRVDRSMLVSCPPLAILARMLRNLKAIYLKRQDHERALQVVDLLLEVDPHAKDELRDRGLLYAALDCYRLAESDLERYLALVPEARDAAELRERIESVRALARRLN
jgi:regulator of sirC expression with transglutaminase-like and TPR domain